jgi:hypothetical protein
MGGNGNRGTSNRRPFSHLTTPVKELLDAMVRPGPGAGSSAARQPHRPPAAACQRQQAVRSHDSRTLPASLQGVPYYEAPGEGEAACAALNICGWAHGCHSLDVDALLFGAQTVYRQLALHVGDPPGVGAQGASGSAATAVAVAPPPGRSTTASGLPPAACCLLHL